MHALTVQEMFPVNRNELWNETFFLYSAVAIAIILLAFFVGVGKGQAPILEHPRLKVLMLKHKVGLILGAIIAGLMVSYLLACRFANNYYFDVTDDSVVVYKPNSIFFSTTTAPFTEISELTVGKKTFIGSYFVQFRYYQLFKKRGKVLLEGLDEQTAFALRDYIASKANKVRAGYRLPCLNCGKLHAEN